MITGYFYSSFKQNNRQWAQIKKTIVLFLYSNLLYLIWGIVKCFLSNETFSELLGSVLSVKAWIVFLCFNEPFLSEHLWYLSALIYVLVIILAIDKYSDREKLYKFIPILLLINILCGNYSAILFGVKLPLILTRNFLFCGLPFFLLGDALRQKPNKLSQKQLLIIAVCSVLLTIVENIILLNTVTDFNADCFIATPFLAYSLFVLFLETRIISDRPFLHKIAQLGKSASTTVYIIHPIAISLVGNLVDAIGGYIPYLNTVWHYTAPLVILISCTLFAGLYRILGRKLPHCVRAKSARKAAH
jgi:hypothetical protein